MRLTLLFIISFSCYNLIQYYSNISITDLFPKLEANTEIEASTGMEVKNPLNEESIYILNGDRISIKSTLDLFEHYKFEYYDHSNGLLYISNNNKIMYASTNQIKWIKVVSHIKNDFQKVILPIGGSLSGMAIGLGIGTGIVLTNCDPTLGSIGAGAGIGALAGGVAGLTATKKGDYYKYSTKKIYLSGKKAWDIIPVDADEIINSGINSANPIY
tara:strand:+ start:4832 stop:5476 length:645 start_codon:yes stop_codon:yes gene_type:complete